MAYKNPESYKLWIEKNRLKVRRYQREYQREYRKRRPEVQRMANANWIKNNRLKYRSSYLDKVVFLGKEIHVRFRQLTGFCSQCSNNIYDSSCKQTQMHHLKYIPCMPWACREELCASCHRKEEIRLSG